MLFYQKIFKSTAILNSGRCKLGKYEIFNYKLISLILENKLLLSYR